MIRLQQYLPAFVEGGTAQIVDCLCWEDLLCVPWVEAFMHTMDGLPFHRFSLGDDGETLIAEYAEGTAWWVVGRFHRTRGVPLLPRFEPKVKEPVF